MTRTGEHSPDRPCSLPGLYFCGEVHRREKRNGASVYAPTFIEDCEAEVKKLQEEYGFEYTVEYVQ